MKSKHCFASCLAVVQLLFATSAFAASAYKVSAEASSDQIHYQIPTFIVESGKTAHIVSPGNGYEISFSVTDADQGNVKVVASLSSEQGKLAPTMVVPIGKAVSVSVGDVELKFTVETAGG